MAITHRAPRQKDLAESLGLSPALVSMVLNGRDTVWVSEETRRRVFAAARDMGYVHKGGAARGTTFFGLITKDINAEIYRGLLRGASRSSSTHATHLGLVMPTDSHHTEESLIAEQLAKGVAGLAIIPLSRPLDAARQQIDPYAGVPVPVVCADLTPPWTERPCVVFDYQAGAEALVDYFLLEGCRRIAILRVGYWHHSVVEARVLGHRLALERRGLPNDPDLVITYNEGEGTLGWSSSEAIERTVDRLLAARADALVSLNDPTTVVVVQALRRRGVRVPGDMRVASFDDADIGRLSDPPLTTMRQPWERMGEEAMRLLRDEVAGISHRGERVVLPVELVIRGT